MAGNPGLRLMSLSPGASIGAYAMNRSYVTLAILAAVMSVAGRRATHAPERGDGPRRAAAAPGSSGPPRRRRRRSSSTLGANVVLAPLLGAGDDRQRAAGGELVRRRRRHRRRGHRVHRRRRADVAALVDRARRQRPGDGRPGGRVRRRAASGTCSATPTTRAWSPTARGRRWLSPIGWGFEMRPFGGDRWWLLVLSVGLAAVLVVAAARYAARRDLGRGVLPVQTGAAEASRAPAADRSAWPGGCSGRVPLVARRPGRVRADLRLGQRQRAHGRGQHARLVPEDGRDRRDARRLVHAR